MNPTTSHISIRSFNCSGCDCGSCASEAVTTIQALPGVVHARLDRRNAGLVVRFDPELIDEAVLRSSICDCRLLLR